MIDREFGGLGHPGGIGKPAFGAGAFGTRIVEPVACHREQGGLVRCRQPGLGDAGPDRRADPELVPEVTRDARNAQFEHGVDRDIGRPAASGVLRRIAALTLTQNAVDAADQALEGGVIDLIGAAEAMDDPGFSSFCGGVPDGLGEGVVGDG